MKLDKTETCYEMVYDCRYLFDHLRDGILLLDLVDGDCLATGWTVLAISALIVDPAMVG